MPGLASDLHRAALAVHKALLDVVRAEYEQVHGPVGNPHELLSLVISHETFAWLRHLSALIVEIDEMEETPDADERDHAAARAAFEELLLRSGPRFADKYAEALQTSPAVVMAHAALKKVLDALPAPREADAALHAERRQHWGKRRPIPD
jgi:hypothetical protein